MVSKRSKLLMLTALSLISFNLYAANNNAANATNTANASKNNATTLAMPTVMDKLSYTLGAELGQNLKKQGVNLNTSLFYAGLKDALAGNKLQLTEDQMRQTVAIFQKQLIQQRTSQFTQAAQKNEQAGIAFLSNNAKQPNVHVLPSGLQYKVLEPGTGASPSDNDTVTVNYVGTLLDGTVFDSSYERGQPSTFPVSEVIPGWQQALKMMQLGATWQLFIPAKLAYGAQGMGDVIGPNETLIFKVQLLAIKSSQN